MIGRERRLQRGKNKNLAARADFENRAAAVADIEIFRVVERNPRRDAHSFNPLLRAAFWGWGGRHYGGGWGKAGYYQNPRERLEQLHKELHGEKPTDSGTTSPPPSGR